MRGTPFIPRDESALQKINIVPECIFCHQPTNNVEIRVIKKVREEYMAYRQVLRTTTTSSIPFPAHHHCYHRKRLAEKITLILACVILVLTFLHLSSYGPPPIMMEKWAWYGSFSLRRLWDCC
jgi:hypothetical protein